jgi:hypothetical protein
MNFLIINIYGLRVGISTIKKFTSGRGWGMTPWGLSYKAFNFPSHPDHKYIWFPRVAARSHPHPLPKVFLRITHISETILSILTKLCPNVPCMILFQSMFGMSGVQRRALEIIYLKYRRNIQSQKQARIH